MRPQTNLLRMSIAQSCCQSSATTLATSASRRTIHTSKPLYENGFTEKMRRKIWGADAPGADDPYRAAPQHEQEAPDEQQSEPQTEEDLDYYPETDARNMLKVGTRGNFRQRHWDKDHPVTIYKTVAPVQQYPQIPTLTRKAVVEAYTNHLVTHDQADNSNATIASFTKTLKPDIKVDIEKTQDGEFRFYYASEKVMNNTAKGMHDRRTYRNIGDAWKELPLVDTQLKFAITKRVRELTGLTIPDAVISHCSTAKDILAYLLAHPKRLKEKPQPIALNLMDKVYTGKPKDDKLPGNVLVHRHRIRPSDIERARGNTEAIAILEAGKFKLRGDNPRDTFLRRRRMLGIGWHGIETFPDAQRTWEDWDKENLNLSDLQTQTQLGSFDKLEDDIGYKAPILDPEAEEEPQTTNSTHKKV